MRTAVGPSASARGRWRPKNSSFSISRKNWRRAHSSASPPVGMMFSTSQRPGTAWVRSSHSAEERGWAVESTITSTVPVALRTSPSASTSAPSAAQAASAAPMATGNPSGIPVSRAACAVTVPTAAAQGTIGGSRAGSRPRSAASPGSQPPAVMVR